MTFSYFLTSATTTIKVDSELFDLKKKKEVKEKKFEMLVTQSV